MKDFFTNLDEIGERKIYGFGNRFSGAQNFAFFSINLLKKWKFIDAKILNDLPMAWEAPWKIEAGKTECENTKGTSIL